jgi:hypothetical protein
MVSAGADRPNCYDCRWRDTIPGDVHSRCRHPLVDNNADLVEVIIGVFSGDYDKAVKKLQIKGHPEGIRKGWFIWPANFNPVFLLTCQGFEPKKEHHAQKE